MTIPRLARYVDLHILQDIPASCLNRGEYNEPKSLMIGNTQRGAISSQCAKRADRHELETLLGEPAARTRMLPPRLAAALREADWPEDLARFAAAQIPRSATTEGLATDPDADDRTLAMLYVPAATILDDLAALCARHRAALEKGMAKEATSTAKTPAAYLPPDDVVRLLCQRTTSISLFGRFLAGLADAHVDGAVQMAWAFTTHASDLQPDFFTAVEDWAQPGDSSSAHLDTGYLNAGVFYRYASVNLTELTRNLDADASQAAALLGAFTDVFISTLPQAKKNSTAPHTLPDTVHYAVRDRRPVSLASAFHQPVKADRHGGYLAPSRHALSQHAGIITQMFGTRHRIAHGHVTQAPGPEPLEHLGERHTSYDDLIDALTTAAGAPATTPRSYMAA
ncbi:type I-E CRISPR-associated protein Cas7/Cse4/CasC [Streptomyces coacervatus]|uniref:Type I-E CRISPR-associated protein Cas7/Cse4/CasC n=1 Tax=Streptomyces coacervatus TaxID=647381 RepID=A0ABP7HMH2_9ACTN|nr:type I-E CRISPR-associated protein Cas7/Cse4/CasC [Streptomyces coacervatus]MDF2272104.1 type I-E CRISPR-associated protein Cas7/Cse4/CasC [Streptomyces coacervatus]